MFKSLLGAAALIFALITPAASADWGCTNVWTGGKLVKTGVCKLSKGTNGGVAQGRVSKPTRK